jgi:hypothetical protein
MKSFTKHNQENHKKYDQVQLNEDQWSSKKHSRKQFITADKKAFPSLKLQNHNIEVKYHSMLTTVKALYATLPNKQDRVIVEMNMKEHPLEVFQMHAFLTPHFMFVIECDVFNQYRIEYCIADCPFEAEIITMIDRLSLESHSTMVRKMPSYKDYFNEVLKVQPERFISVI